MDEAVSISNLTYSHSTGDQPSLLDINLHLPQGSRTILVGANGGWHPNILTYYLPCSPSFSAGKSTLLQIMAGKRLVTTLGADIRVKGRDVFRDSPSGVTFLGTDWFVAICNLK